MRKHLSLLHEKLEPWNLFTGIVIGVGVGLYVYSVLPPTVRGVSTGTKVVKMHRMDHGEMGNIVFAQAGMQGGMYGNTLQFASSPMIRTEKDFVQQMLVHHEMAVVMSQQVLTLNPRTDIKNLATTIIGTQSAEINLLKNWLSNWEK